jgi:predicted RNA-binding protein (TIGR00451 family)
MMPKLRTDKGAIKFVLSGANIMCPGLTHPGATMHDEVRFCCLTAHCCVALPQHGTLMAHGDDAKRAVFCHAADAPAG